MKRMMTKGWALTLLSGAVLFQAAACTGPLVFTTAVSSAVTAGGVLFIINRIVND